MKFAKELEEDLVPEWRAKYFDYKVAKKKLKAVNRALKNVDTTPRTPGRRLPANLLTNGPQSTRVRSKSDSAKTTPEGSLRSAPSRTGSIDGRLSRRTSEVGKPRRASFEHSRPIQIPEPASPPSGPDSADNIDGKTAPSYGSFIPSPSSHVGKLGPPSLELPDPALPPEEDAFAKHHRAWQQSHSASKIQSTPPTQQSEGKPGDAYQVGRQHQPGLLESTHLLPKHKRFLRPRRIVSTPYGGTQRHRPDLLRRFFSNRPSPATPAGDVPLEAYKIYEEKQGDFFRFLDSELGKIESFYRMKEEHANKRLRALRDQLHEMRDRRVEEIREEQEAKKRHHHQNSQGILAENAQQNGQKGQPSTLSRYMKPLERAIGLGPARIGKTSKALQKLGSPNAPAPHAMPGTTRPESWGDFTRRPEGPDIPYRAAKRKLKLALQEFYRGLELLKSYALLNRTAFRKINKKFDKVVKARPTQRYMTEKVNKSWFVQSEVLDHQIVAVEDLYARYFERGNHKVAVGKLRSKTSKAGDYTGSVFRNGMLIAGALVFGVQGLVYGSQHLASTDPKVHLDTSYLLQIYGGYFLMLFLFLLFCVDCKIWNGAKINYPFIFEFDARHNLDWRQLAELPCVLLFLLGLFIWLNFQQNNTNVMFLYWPIILIGLSAIILFLPAPILYHRSREWWAYSNFRLLLAGIYPVEFRDFFLGDMYCSQTYSMGNLELFFCLYAHHWSNPAQCNSNHSRLLGFLSTLPGIWRGLQCLRRYYDTRNAFPHLVNFGKYTFTILTYMSLSLYRIDRQMSLKAFFIFCATINAIYCSIWDLAMDWSLLNPYADKPFLRDVLGYKRAWVYYVAMVLDPILRFNWIFYAIFGSDIQHSALMSFLIGFSEVCRRGMWSLFRVENEHCTNVGRFRASRDVPLPYDLPSPSRSQMVSPSEEDENADRRPTPFTRSNTLFAQSEATATSSTLEAQDQPRLRRRTSLKDSDTPIVRGIARVGTAMTRAHAEDFERKRRTPDATIGVEDLERSPHYEGRTVGYESSDEEDQDDHHFAVEDDEEGEEVEQEEVTTAAAAEDHAAAAAEESSGEGGPVARLRAEERREERRAEIEEERAESRDMLSVHDVLERRRSAVE